MRRWALMVGIVVGVLPAASCGGGNAGSTSALNMIVFSSDRGRPPQVEAETYDTRRLDLYLMEANGSHVRRLTKNFLTDVFPAVSRDGKHIAFTRDIHGYAQVFVMDVRG